MKSKSGGTINKIPGASRILEASSSHRNLKELEVGEASQILGFIKHDDTVKRIEAMGLRKGKQITVLRKLGRGILVKTSNTRIVITSDVAKNIEVK